MFALACKECVTGFAKTFPHFFVMTLSCRSCFFPFLLQPLEFFGSFFPVAAFCQCFSLHTQFIFCLKIIGMFSLQIGKKFILTREKFVTNTSEFFPYFIIGFLICITNLLPLILQFYNSFSSFNPIIGFYRCFFHQLFQLSNQTVFCFKIFSITLFQLIVIFSSSLIYFITCSFKSLPYFRTFIMAYTSGFAPFILQKLQCL